MDVLVIEGKEYKQQSIENTLEAMQALVGGYIEVVPIGSGYLAICNEEGRIHNLPRNALGLYGTCFVCRQDEFNPEELRGLSKKEIEICEYSLNHLFD